MKGPVQTTADLSGDQEMRRSPFSSFLESEWRFWQAVVVHTGHERRPVIIQRMPAPLRRLDLDHRMTFGSGGVNPQGSRHLA